MHHLACYHRSTFQAKLTTFWGVLVKKKTPKNGLKWAVSEKSQPERGGGVGVG